MKVSTAVLLGISTAVAALVVYQKLQKAERPEDNVEAITDRVSEHLQVLEARVSNVARSERSA